MKRRRVRQFPRVPQSVATSRAWLREQLVEITPVPGDHLIDDALLGLSEIATNAVEHGGGRRFTVACTLLGDTLTITALDGGRKGSTLPSTQDPPTTAEERGRGLFIINEISGGDWGWDTRVGGRMRVRFNLHLRKKPVPS